MILAPLALRVLELDAVGGAVAVAVEGRERLVPLIPVRLEIVVKLLLFMAGIAVCLGRVGYNPGMSERPNQPARFAIGLFLATAALVLVLLATGLLQPVKQMLFQAGLINADPMRGLE